MFVPVSSKACWESLGGGTFLAKDWLMVPSKTSNCRSVSCFVPAFWLDEPETLCVFFFLFFFLRLFIEASVLCGGGGGGGGGVEERGEGGGGK